jgi:hypothetical protein
LPATVALLLPAGLPAVLLVVPWFLLTLLLAVYGLSWLVAYWDVPEEQVIGAGLLMVPVGGFWLLFSRAGRPLLDFGEPLVTLTAIHFHYMTLAALLIGGITGRFLRRAAAGAWRLYRPAAAGLIVAPPLIALGITFSLALEAAATILLALSLLLLAALTLARVLPALGRSWPAALLTLSAAAVVAAMLLATAYATGRLTGAWSLPIPTMVRLHGWLNALGFALPGLLAWTLVGPPAPGEKILPGTKEAPPTS